MTDRRLLVDEHVPGPVVRVFQSLGYDVVRAKATLSEGAADRRLLEVSGANDRLVLTADQRFTIVDGSVFTDHAGVVYADQSVLQTRPADAAEGVDRIFTSVPEEERRSNEFYLSHWMGES